MLDKIIKYESALNDVEDTIEPAHIIDLPTLESIVLEILDEGFDLVPASDIRKEVLSRGYTHFQSNKSLTDIRGTTKRDWSVSQSLARSKVIKRYSKRLFRRATQKPLNKK